MSILLSLLLSGCCRNEVAPILDTPQIRSTDENSAWTVPLEDIVLDSSLELNELSCNAKSLQSRRHSYTRRWVDHINPIRIPF